MGRATPDGRSLVLVTSLAQDSRSNPKFEFRPEKAAEAIHLISLRHPGSTQYFVGKYLYLADKLHYLEWGRPITYDNYVAMKHGPVPSATRNMLAAAAGLSIGMDVSRFNSAQSHADDLVRLVKVELEVAVNGERQKVYPRFSNFEMQQLSQSDVECLNMVLNENSDMTFGGLREKTHKDEAWGEAWYGRANGRVADINILLWAPPEDREALYRQLMEYGISH